MSALPWWAPIAAYLLWSAAMGWWAKANGATPAQLALAGLAVAAVGALVGWTAAP